MPLPPHHPTFDNAYTILVMLAGAHESGRADFLHEFTKDEPTHEWRFQGKLGFGGKFRRHKTSKTLYVTCYPEDATSERKKIIAAVNDELRRLPFA